MDVLHSRPMPVADHFMMASWDYAAGQTGAADPGEVCEKCYAYCAGGKTELWRHARDEHGADPNLSCHVPGCGRRFFAAAMCTDHFAHHLDGGDGQRSSADDDDGGDRPPLTCELCGRLSANRSTFAKHVNAAHREAWAAMCGVCYSYEGDVQSLIDHVQRRHVAEMTAAETTTKTATKTATKVDKVQPKRLRSRRTIRCTVCGKRYGNNSTMRAHRRVHGLADDDDDDLVPAHPQRSRRPGTPTATCSRSRPVHA